MVPKPLKERASAPKSREWNPATPYIILSLLVGSQAIQILWLKQERAHSLRKAEAKIGLLREVIERLQKGEDVDVEGVLGTGRDADEKEWAEGRFPRGAALESELTITVLKDIQEEEVLFQDKKKRKAMRELAASQASEQTSVDGTEKEQGQVKVESIGGVKFY
jgi:hypothetical protein